MRQVSRTATLRRHEHDPPRVASAVPVGVGSGNWLGRIMGSVDMATDSTSSEKLYWHCECGNHEPAHPPYEHGDHEPCIYCDSTSRVVTLREGAAWEQAKALGRKWRP